MVPLDIMLYCIYSNLIYAPYNSTRADYAKWTDVYITTGPGHACSIPLFATSMQPIEHKMTC